MNLDESAFDDNVNNNVDENSNDHQYNEYIHYHQQFNHHDYLAHNSIHPQNDAQSQAVRERIYQRNQRISNPVDQTDRAPQYAPPEREFLRPILGTSHRRNYSEDLSLNSEYLPTLPSRNQSSETSPQYQWNPIRRRQPSSEEIRNGAEELLINFTVEQFHNENIDPSSIVQRPYTNPTWARAGRDLRMLADAFSKSNEREQLRRKAIEVNMSSITMDNFFQLCGELFQGDGGVTQMRIVVLFTFISDVAIQHVRIKAEHFIHTIMTWSLRFIYERICAWVQQAGGWGVVLNQGASLLFKISMISLASLSIVALGVYIIKTVKEL